MLDHKFKKKILQPTKMYLVWVYFEKCKKKLNNICIVSNYGILIFSSFVSYSLA